MSTDLPTPNLWHLIPWQVSVVIGGVALFILIVIYFTIEEKPNEA